MAHDPPVAAAVYAVAENDSVPGHLPVCLLQITIVGQFELALPRIE